MFFPLKKGDKYLPLNSDGKASLKINSVYECIREHFNALIYEKYGLFGLYVQIPLIIDCTNN